MQIFLIYFLTEIFLQIGNFRKNLQGMSAYCIFAATGRVLSLNFIYQKDNSIRNTQIII